MGPTLPKGTLEHLKTVTHQLAVDRVSFSLVEVDRYRVLVPFSQVVCVLEGVKIGRTDREIMDYEMIQQLIALIGIVARGVYLLEGADTPSSEIWNVCDLQSTSLGKNSGTDWRHGVDIRPYLALQLQQGENEIPQQSTALVQRLEVVVWVV